MEEVQGKEKEESALLISLRCCHPLNATPVTSCLYIPACCAPSLPSCLFHDSCTSLSSTFPNTLTFSSYLLSFPLLLSFSLSFRLLFTHFSSLLPPPPPPLLLCFEASYHSCASLPLSYTLFIFFVYPFHSPITPSPFPSFSSGSLSPLPSAPRLQNFLYLKFRLASRIHLCNDVCRPLTR